MHDGRWKERSYAPDESFCLTMLRQPAVAYLAATHPDHGVPVYQELEQWLSTGCALGEAMKHTYDGVVLANGGRALAPMTLADGDPLPAWGPTELMLYGTASRVLFGDPRLAVCGPVTAPDTPEMSEPVLTDGLARVEAVFGRPRLPFQCMDTFHSDLSAVPNGFNDRLCVSLPLEAGQGVSSLEARVAVGHEGVRSRVVGHAVEGTRGEGRLLRAQVDVPSTGYQQGPIRRRGCSLSLALRLAEE